MTLEKAYNQLTKSDKKRKLIEAGYRFERCVVCNGLGQISNPIKAVYYGIPGLHEICLKCAGEGGVWFTP